jgi:hypothetical protein
LLTRSNMRGHRDRPSPLHVRIVSANAETLDGLQAYLRQAGIDARGTREVETGAGSDPAPGAVVFFPDEFGIDRALGEIARLRRARPQTLIVMVTGEPKRFAEALVHGEGPSQALVVAKPAWGWTILDAIRGRLESR